MPTETTRMAVADVVVGKRIRQDAPNIAQITESIREIGLLHPLVVNSRKELIAGFRRLQAVKRLGWSDVPVTVIETLDDALAALRAERDENTCREPLTPSEMVEIGRQIEAIERPEAARRQARPDMERSGKLPEQARKGDTRDKVGEALGVSGKTYEKAKKVTEAAEAEPDKFGDLKQMMDDESVDAAHKEMKRRKAGEFETNEIPFDDDSEDSPELVSEHDVTANDDDAGVQTEQPHKPHYPPHRPGKPPPPRPDYPEPYASLFDGLTDLSTKFTKFINSDDSEKFREFIGVCQLGWVNYTRAKIKNGKKINPQWVAFQAVRALLRAAYKNRKIKTKKQLIELLAEEGGDLLDLHDDAEVPANG